MANTYYLKPNTGSDGNSGLSIGSPWKTISKAKTALAPGDTLNILAGTYTPSQYSTEAQFPLWSQSNSAGTPGNPITIQANPGDTVIFDGQVQSNFIYFEPSNGVSPSTPRYVIIKDLTFTHYYSAAISFVAASYIAVINCTFLTFYQGGAGNIGTYDAHHIILKNNRTVLIGDLTFGATGAADHGQYISAGSQYIVDDGNYFETIAGYTLHGYGGQDYTRLTRNWIIRNNTLVNAHSAAFIAASTNFQNVYFYNNTIYQDQSPFTQIDTNSCPSYLNLHLGAQLTNTVIRNNIGYGYASVAPIWSDSSTQFNGSLILDYNLWTNFTNQNILYSWNFTTYNLASFQGATGYEAHSKVQDPVFVNIPGRNFNLQSNSPCINAGTTLTTTVGSSSGTTITLADAGYFHDGYGLITGDVIRVGASTVTILSVNYTTNVITVSEAITVANGAPVSLPFNGTAPDMGAYESAFGLVPGIPSTHSPMTPQMMIMVAT